MNETNRRFLALDGLRGLAALLVVLYHVELPNHFTRNSFTRHGYLAVDLFLILSGFVISAAYSRRIFDKQSAFEFYWLRVFRIYPLHLAMLVAFVLVECVKLAALQSGAITPGQQAPFTGNNTIGALIANVLMLQGIGIINGLSWNSVSWSISCEFVAYLLFSLVTWSGLVRARGFFVVGVIAAAGGFAFVALSTQTMDVVTGLALTRCLSGFMFGMLVFRISSGKWGQRLTAQSSLTVGACELTVIASLVLAMSLAPAPIQRGLPEAYPGALLVIIFLLVLMVAVFYLDRGPVSVVLKSRPIQFLGRISYSIYMVHVFIWLIFSIVLKRVFRVGLPGTADWTMSPWTGDALVTLQVAIVIAVSAITFVLIEEPARRYGRRRLSARARQRQLQPMWSAQ